MTFLPTVELLPERLHALQADTLTFNRGQWVTLNGAKGRFLSNKGGVVSILWRFKEEPFREYNLRFKRACLGHKVSRPARSPSVKTDTATPSPTYSQQQDAFLFELTHVRSFEDSAGDWFDDPLSDEESYTYRPGALVEGYQLLMQCRSALLLQSCVTGRKSIVLREVATARGLCIFPSSGYAHYPAGWRAPTCH